MYLDYDMSLCGSSLVMSIHGVFGLPFLLYVWEASALVLLVNLSVPVDFLSSCSGWVYPTDLDALIPFFTYTSEYDGLDDISQSRNSFSTWFHLLQFSSMFLT